MTQYRNKRDANESAIIAEMRQTPHISVVTLTPPGPDIFAQIRYSAGAFFEIKVPGPKAVYTRTQLEWIATSGYINVAIIKSAAEGIDALKRQRFLTQEQKDKLAMMLYRERGRDRFTPSEVEAVIYGGEK